ncbi:hypothetical protein EIP86_009346 [Pleurotus ostreatoroseus]|nr:hypothetical protein EIP86_009346 [Pleurotus ostreatoroseus]
MDSSEVGRFGTLCLMKRLEPDKVVAAYPIDDEEISFGRDPACSIRLYYDAVSAVHCKIVFVDRKAFLVVLGTNGLFVDGCPVFPSAPSSANPVTVPLPNNSTIEIHKKRFQFCYPPKELRAALLATPSKDTSSNGTENANGAETSTPERARRRRALRMSMIQSAQVFTPRPSANAQENLRILKTPIKNPFPTPQRARRRSSPLKRGAAIVEEDEPAEGEDDDDEGREEEEIVLVETNHPSVVEEDRDLVILERVVVREPPPAPPTPPQQQYQQRQVQFPFVAPSPQRQAAPPQTPRRRPPRASLHRAVLIRSAQRAAMRQEMEMEEEEEEEEVEEVEEEVDSRQAEGRGAKATEDLREEDEDENGEENPSQSPGPLSSLRKSLTAVRNAWPFRASSVPQEEEAHGATEHDEEQDITEAHDFDDEHELDHEHEHEHDENQPDEDEPMDEEPAHEDPHGHPAASSPHPTPRIPNRPPPLGRFMTPQTTRHRDFAASGTATTARPRRGRGPIRYSVGGFTPGGIQSVHSYSQGQPPVQLMLASKAEGAPSGPRRVRLVEPWKVGDIVVPLAGGEDEEDGEGGELKVEDVGKVEDEEGWEDEREEEVKDERGTPDVSMGPPATPLRGRREKLSEEERQAIIERRRSALRTPDTFFGGQVPGSRRLSLFPLSPAKPSTSGAGMLAPIPAPSFGTPASTPAATAAPSTPARVPSASTSAPSLTNDESKPDLLSMPAASSSLPSVAEADEDTSVLLARMKQMVEGAKRRQSMSAPTPRAQAQAQGETGTEAGGEAMRRFSLLAPDAHRAFDPVKPVFVPESEDENGEPEAEAEGTSDKENGDVSMGAETDADQDAHEDADIEMGAASIHPSTSTLTASRQQPQETPRFDGLRHMFAQPRQMETPRMDGVRGLFGVPKARAGVMGTPAFEGVGEMLATPEAFKSRQAPDQDEAHDAEGVEEVEMDVLAQVEQEAALGAREGDHPGDEHGEMHEGSDDEEADGHAPARRGKAPSRGTRGRKPASSSSRTPSTRSLRSTPKPASQSKDIPPEEMNEEGDDEALELPAPAAARVTRKPRLRSQSADREPATASTSAEPPRSTRRTRKATASPPGGDAEDAPATTKRRTRRTPTPEVQTGAAPPPPSTRRKAKTPVAIVEEEDEENGDDPLDSIARAVSPEIPMPGPSTVRRSARGKLTIAVKEEEDESPAPVPPKPTATRAVRGRRGVAAGTGIPRSVGRGGSIRRVGASATRATAASAAKGKASAAKEKENTPERQTAASPVEGEPAGTKSSIPRTATRGKVTRSAGRVRASEEPEPQAKASRVRARK